MSVEGTTRRVGPPQLSAGSRFGGYRIEGTLGHGGMGIVYLARQLELDRPVALKVIRPELAGDQHFRARFRSESRTAASIEHPRVVTVFGAGELDGLLYVAMRYVPGKDLGQLIATGGALPPGGVAELIAQVADGLDAVHAAGLVHRDVKPANVIVAGPVEGSASATAYLTDFGLAKAAAATDGLTVTGELIGSVDYMAPEQIEGRRVDARADVYALGCVLLHAVTGRVPFPDRESSAKMWAHLNEPAPAAGSRNDAASALDPVIRRAMAKDPADRFPSAGDFGRAALAALRHEAVTEPERTVGAGEAAPTETARLDTEPTPVRTRKLPTRRPRRRKRRFLLATAAVALIAALGAAAVIEVPKLSDGGGAPPAKPAGIKLPSLAGEPLDAAQQRLDELGLRASEVGGGLFGVLIPTDWDVCETQPPAGTSVRRGSTVQLLVDRPEVC